LVLSAHKRVTLQCTIFSLSCCMCRFRSFGKAESATKGLDLMPGVLFQGQIMPHGSYLFAKMRNLNNGPQTFVCCKRKGFSFGDLRGMGLLGPFHVGMCGTIPHGHYMFYPVVTGFSQPFCKGLLFTKHPTLIPW
jgi:hypothetical protein